MVFPFLSVSAMEGERERDVDGFEMVGGQSFHSPGICRATRSTVKRNSACIVKA
jgi:hypothetical protein